MKELNKSLMALDAAADELLQKSKKTDDDVKPDDIAGDDADNNDNDDDVQKGEDTTEGDDTVQKCDNPDGDNINKSDTDDDDDSDDADDEEDDENVSKSIDDIQDSINDDFTADPDIVKGLENSEFNAAVVATLVKSLSEIQYDMNQNKKASDDVSKVLAKSLQASLVASQKLAADNAKLIRRINKLEKSLDQSMERIMEAVDTISVEPAHVRKSVNSIAVHDKNFSKSLGNNDLGGFESLSKSQILGILSNELYTGNAAVTAADVVGFESGAPLRPELQALVASKCKA